MEHSIVVFIKANYIILIETATYLYGRNIISDKTYLDILDKLHLINIWINEQPKSRFEKTDDLKFEDIPKDLKNCIYNLNDFLKNKIFNQNIFDEIHSIYAHCIIEDLPTNITETYNKIENNPMMDKVFTMCEYDYNILRQTTYFNLHVLFTCEDNHTMRACDNIVINNVSEDK